MILLIEIYRLVKQTSQVVQSIPRMDEIHIKFDKEANRIDG